MSRMVAVCAPIATVAPESGEQLTKELFVGMLVFLWVAQGNEPISRVELIIWTLTSFLTSSFSKKADVPGKKALIPLIPLAGVKHLLKLSKLQAMRAGASAKTYWLVFVLNGLITVGFSKSTSAWS